MLSGSGRGKVVQGYVIACASSDGLSSLTQHCKSHRQTASPCSGDRSCVDRGFLYKCLILRLLPDIETFRLLLRIGDLTFGTNKQHRSIQSEFQSYLTSFRSRFLLLWCLLLFLFFRRRRWWLRLQVMNDSVRLLHWLNDVCNRCWGKKV